MFNMLYRSQVSIREFRPSLIAGSANLLLPRNKNSEFLYHTVLKEACDRIGLKDADQVTVPDAEWWRQLCASCGEKVTSKYGGRLLREKLVHNLSQRLAVEQQYMKHGAEIEACVTKDPIFIIGLPRCEGHGATHVLARSGCWLTPTTPDAMFPGEPTEFIRRSEGRKWIRKIGPSVFPYLQTVRTFREDKVEDDLTIHLQVPQSVAWGMLHGLQDHLYKALQEDQQPVFDYQARVLKLLRWYHNNGQMDDNVTRESVGPDVPVDTAIRGTKDVLTYLPWLIHSPLGLMYIEELHRAFPDMKLIWVHRALNQCVPSMCSSLAIHDTVYTGRRPTETQLANIGEQVVGFLGSGSEYAVDYLGNFPRKRMVHWHNREIKRSVIRLMTKTFNWWGFEVDHYRKMNAISAATEYSQLFRPKHDYEMGFFGIHDGILGEAFDAYILQFQEYAFEKKFGIKHQNLDPLSANRHQYQISNNEHKGPAEGHAIGLGGRPAGTYLQWDQIANNR